MDKTPEGFIQAIRDLAAWDPDYVDPYSQIEFMNCEYKAGSTYPGCIVGQAAARVGFMQNQMLETDSISRFIRHLFGDSFSSRQVDWVRDVQLNQDSGMRWGESVCQADIRIPL